MVIKPSILVVALALVGVAGCGDSDDAGDSGPAAAGDNAPSVVEVDIADFEFGPSAIEVAAGGEITWTNSDVATHTATTEPGAPAKFDTGIIEKGASESATLDEPGEYSYICSLHPTMKATVTVTGR